MTANEKAHDFLDFMLKASKDMADEYARIQKRVSEDPGTAGDQGEENWAEFFRHWLPSSFHVTTKGRILNENGVSSPQVDVLILSPSYPPGLHNNKTYLAAGVVAAFECKITLRRDDIRGAFSNSAAIRRLLPMTRGTPYRELNSNIIYGVLAHSHCWKEPASTPAKNIENHIGSSDKNSISHPREMPDLICVSDLGTWRASKLPLPDSSNVALCSGYVLHAPMLPPEGFTPIGTMLVQLYRRMAWEFPEMRPLATYFTRTKRSDRSDGSMRPWPVDIYSHDLQGHLKQRPTGVGVPGNWDEWYPETLM